MSALPKLFISAADFLEGERSSKIKHEYFAGEVFAMAGASERHNLIAGNTFASLHAQLRRRTCNVYPSDMRIKISQTGLYTYPDIAVVCGAAQFEDDTLLNPTLIVEVLSPSTESYDRGRKFQHYRTLESLTDYLLVAQDGVHIEHFTRQADNRWVLTEVDQIDALLSLPTIACDLALADVYEKVVGMDIGSQNSEVGSGIETQHPTS